MDEKSLLRLRSEHLDLALAPAVGGAIARLEFRDGSVILPVLRGCASDLANVLAMASFPLIPYCNRIRDGHFSFRGREVTLDANMAGDPSPLHGQGWLHPWEVVGSGEKQAELRFRHPAGEWPWTYEARQVFALTGEALEVGLSCRNLSDLPMPCGLGQHPYFPCTNETRLDAEVKSVWTIDAKVLPVEKLPAVGRYDLRDRRVCGQDLDNGFGGWSGEAQIDDPALPFRIRLSSPDAAFFQLYSPVDGGLFVAEPVTHANAALNEPEQEWGDLGLEILEPGEEMLLRMRIGIVPK